MKRKALLLLTLIFCSIFSLSANEPDDPPEKREVKVYHTKKIQEKAPVIDGDFNDPVWESVEWGSNFKQREPNDGQPESQETLFKILYDNSHIYVAIKAKDNKPGEIVRRLSRRDGFEGDFVEVMFDSYYDKRTAFSFTATAAGVKGDEMITADGDNTDDSWDPIWYLETKIADDGWNAEMKIPFSQLRFGDKEEQVWGLQVLRRLFRKEERTIWQHIPQESPGWVHLFGELRGIKNIKPTTERSITPYTVASYETFEKEEGNPFATGTDKNISFGLDGKIGLTNDLTLDYTINPDFGQVEADPSEVNLTAFETFFQEKRPFFIEGNNITNFSVTPGNGGFSRDNLFYSRRIGRRPHHYPEIEDDEFIDMPEQTTILGAAKLTGKTKNGLSLGFIESFTQKEYAEVDNNGERRSIPVEPFTSYSLGRVQKDLNNGNTLIGGMFTSVLRKIDEKEFNNLHSQAYSGGFDFKQYWKQKKYYIAAKTVFSHVKGDKEAILETQESPLRYYQRPDAEHVGVDTSQTSLTGHGGTINLGKQSHSGLRFNVMFTWRSPGLELNDIGYLRRADQIMQSVWAGYRIGEPFSIFRSISINVNQWTGFDFSGTNIFKGGNINMYARFKNHWGFGSGINREGSGISNHTLWGGPSIKYDAGWGNWVNLHSDTRKKVYASMGGFFYRKNEIKSSLYNIWSTIRIRPMDAFSITLNPQLSLNQRELQYVTSDEFGENNETEYIFATIDRKTLSFTIRLDYNITPELTIQYYGQPYFSAGKYTDFKRITNPQAEDAKNQFVYLTENEHVYNSESDEYLLSLHDQTLTIENPDFNSKFFSSNLVIRWEYIPGSSFYVIWSQSRYNSTDIGKFNFSDDVNNLFDEKAHNVFLIKFSYRFG